MENLKKCAWGLITPDPNLIEEGTDRDRVGIVSCQHPPILIAFDDTVYDSAVQLNLRSFSHGVTLLKKYVFIQYGYENLKHGPIHGDNMVPTDPCLVGGEK